MKKIFLSIFLLLALILSSNITNSYYTNNSYNDNYGYNNNNYNDNYRYDNNYNDNNRYNNNYSNGSCDSWRYWSYSYPRISDWRTYTARSWNRIVVLECNNWYVSVKSTRYNSYNNNNQNNNYSNGSCNAWKYSIHSFPNLDDWETHTSRVWSTTAVLICKNWYVSIDSTRTYFNNSSSKQSNGSCNAWKYWIHSFPSLSDRETHTSRVWSTTAVLVCKNWYVSIKSSNTDYNDWYVNDSTGSCNSWRYWIHSFPALSDKQTHTSIVWSTTAILVCKNWYVSIKNSNTAFNDWYVNDSNGSCNAWKYTSHSFPSLSNWQTFDSKKYINWWIVTTTLICRNSYVSIKNTVTSCNSWFENSWTHCEPREIFNKSCPAGNHGWYRHPSLRHWKTHTVKRRLNRQYVYKVLKCNNWRVSIRNTYWSWYGFWGYDYNRYWSDIRINIPFLHF